MKNIKRIQDAEGVDIQSLTGKHRLSGVDIETECLKPGKYLDAENCSVIRFRLDGKTYMAIEDPDDGYRSSMRNLIVTNDKIKNSFKPVEVFGMMKQGGYYKSDIIQFYDTVTAKLVLEVGTDNTDDYYPSFVGNFRPENLILNYTIANQDPLS